MDFINEHANIFFFVTTIFVTVLICIGLIILFFVLRFYGFMSRLIVKGEDIVEKNKDNKFVTTSLPILLPILTFFFNMKSKKRKKER